MITDKTITTKYHDTIKLGIDAHAKWDDVTRQLDGTTVRSEAPARLESRRSAGTRQ